MPLNFALPALIAHRGESGLAPENTLAAFQLAAENGATWVELDANISADHIPFVHHDDAIDRCTNGSGYLNLNSSATLHKLDAGSWFDEQFRDEALPTLSAVIDLLNVNKMGLNLEIKPIAGWEDPTADAVCDVLKAEWPENLPLLISSFSERALLRAARNMPDTPRGYLVAAIPPDWAHRMQTLDCHTLHCAADCIDQRLASEIKSAGYGLLCYTVNDADQALQLLEWGVDSVFTDYPSQLLPAIRQSRSIT